MCYVFSGDHEDPDRPCDWVQRSYITGGINVQIDFGTQL